MLNEPFGIPSSPRMAGSHSLEAVCVTMGRLCPTISLQNLMKTLLTLSKIAHPTPFVPTLTLPFPTAMLTLTPFQSNWAFPGSPPRPSHSLVWSPSWASAGIYQTRQLRSRKKRRINTRTQSRNGSRRPPIPWKRSRSLTASYYTPASWHQQDVLTSPAWKPCWGLPLQVLLFHTTHPKAPMTISSGGSAPSAPKGFLVEFLVHVTSRITARSRMPAQESALQSSSQAIGELGGSFQGGKLREGTLGGPKQSALNSLYVLSSQLVSLASTSGSLVTTGASLKGGKEGVTINKPTSSSGESTTSSLLANALLSHATSQARRTQQMPLPGASTHRILSSSLLSKSQVLYDTSSQTLTVNLPHASSSLKLLGSTPSPTQSQNGIPDTPPIVTNRARPLLIHMTDSGPATLHHNPRMPKPTAYAPNLTPIPSPLRPHCLARDRLRMWKPAPYQTNFPSNISIASLSEQDVSRIFEVTSNAWAESTHEAYSSGILAFHVHCDKRNIPEHLRAPISHPLVASFVASLAGSYSASTISNYVHGVRAWHILHGLPWRLNPIEMDALMKGAERLAPASSKRKKCLPYTLVFMASIRLQLCLDQPLDAAVWACLTTCFYAAARVGELTVPRLTSFDPAYHITPSNLRTEINRDSLEATVLHIPHTKAAPMEGEDIFWSRQNGPTDPYEAMDIHFRVNRPSSRDHLFSYTLKGARRPLTKQAFVKRLALAARAAGLDPLQGHGIRIGATLHYLTLGMPMEAMKVMGRWGSDAFLRYLRKHAQILTPYIQANPEVHDTFSRFIMPSQLLLQGRR